MPSRPGRRPAVGCNSTAAATTRGGGGQPIAGVEIAAGMAAGRAHHHRHRHAADRPDPVEEQARRTRNDPGGARGGAEETRRHGEIGGVQHQ